MDNTKLKIIYTTRKGEKLYSEPGSNGPNDLRLYIGYNGSRWAHTLELIGAALRAKAHVEDRNYPNGRGRMMLFDFISDCILKDDPIKELIKRYSIPDRWKNGHLA